MSSRCGELRQCESDGFLTARTSAVCSARQALPHSVLFALNSEMMPLPIIKRLRKVVLPRPGVIRGAHCFNLLLKELADGGAFCRRPSSARAEQEPACLSKNRWELRIRFPNESKHHPGAHRTCSKFFVYVVLPFQCAVKEVVQMLGNVID